jgi:hypothetical protein
MAKYEERVDRERSKSLRLHHRDILARDLKVLAMTRSTRLAKEERAAEEWVAQMLSFWHIPYPKQKSRPADFNRMFAVNRVPDDDPERDARLTEARRGVARELARAKAAAAADEIIEQTARNSAE